MTGDSRSRGCRREVVVSLPYADVAAAVPDNLCRCGGRAPCQDNHDSTGTSCHEMLADASGVLACWHGHRTQCDCDCKPETPCRYVDPASKKGYCFATEVDAVSGGAACPENTKKCNAPARTGLAGELDVQPGGRRRRTLRRTTLPSSGWCS